MENLIIAFVTGLTTGGLSCLAVQGGLLASSLSGQIEKNLQHRPRKNRSAAGSRNSGNSERAGLGWPILAFLIAKLIAYTMLGMLLGMVGQMFQLTPMTRAILQIGIGIFMLGTALRMLNVHPIFRYFAFEPPAFLRRKLRRTASQSNGASLLSPVFLGFMTVLIPCGVTQAMMAVAIGTGSPTEGAALMFAFTLGTSPVFFAISYFATKIGEKLEKHFMRFVAVVILVLAVITIDSGAVLAGSPFSLSRMVGRIFPAPVVEASAPQLASMLPTNTPAPGTTNGGKFTTLPAELAAEDAPVTINVENYGYQPEVVHARAGVPVTINLVTNGVYSCSRAFVIPSLNVQEILPETGVVSVNIPAQEKGKQIPFSCSMGMYTGTLVFDL